MAVLLVEPNRDDAAAALEIIRWTDSRWRVDTAEHGAEAWDKALSRRPSLVLCAPVLPDLSGARLCSALRTRLRRTRFLAYATSDSLVEDSGEGRAFDGVVRKPLERYAWISYLRQHRIVTTAIGEEASPLPEVDDSSFATIPITVQNAAEPELRFGVPVPIRATIAMVLRQLGKSHIQSFRLLRKGVDLPANINTPVQRDDLLILGTAVSAA